MKLEYVYGDCFIRGNYGDILFPELFCELFKVNGATVVKFGRIAIVELPLLRYF